MKKNKKEAHKFVNVHEVNVDKLIENIVDDFGSLV